MSKIETFHSTCEAMGTVTSGSPQPVVKMLTALRKKRNDYPRRHGPFNSSK